MRSGAPSRPPRDRSSTTRVLTDVYLGLLAFGLLNVLALLAGNTSGVRQVLAAGGNVDWMIIYAALLLFMVGAVAAWAYVRAGRRGLAFGMLGGYALITAVSGGACTGWGLQRPTSTFNGSTGVYTYLAAVVIFTVALIVAGASSLEAERKEDDE
ncbi:MAG TPA: hypothetical protein VLA19_03115 [Herpetosiphonaceae bacterium]|nr:hypothetical protein [Herpetosiphonaceae bacterium]